MRKFQDFSLKEWLVTDPFVYALKEKRNDIRCNHFCAARTPNQNDFIQQTKKLRGKSIALVVAFNQSWTIDWLFRMAKSHVPKTNWLVFDNSLDSRKRPEIKKLCNENNIHYLGLPPNPERHPCRSHGLAMTWIYHNIVRKIEPCHYAYIDHDLIPLTDVDFAERLGKQKFFGRTNTSKWGYNLWAGYCMFNYQAFASLPLNFNNDKTMGLDTGGRNWEFIYSKYDRATVRLVEHRKRDVVNPMTGETHNLEIVDDRWLHLCGAGYHHTYKERQSFYEGIAKATDEGATITDLVPSLRKPSNGNESGFR